MASYKKQDGNDTENLADMILKGTIGRFSVPYFFTKL